MYHRSMWGSGQAIAWWENNAGVFTQHVISNTFPGAYSVYATDMDDDGDIDGTDLNGFLTIFGIKYVGSCGFTECKGDFDCDRDVDGTDSKGFKNGFGRAIYHNPCTDSNPCTGDFDGDKDCDGLDAAGFKGDFGRNMMKNPCRGCVEQ